MTGGFNYDGTTFSNFVVSYDGYKFDFTQQANAGFAQPSSPQSLCQTGSTFNYLSMTGACAPDFYVYEFTAMQQVVFDFAVTEAISGQGGIPISQNVAQVSVSATGSTPSSITGTLSITDVTPVITPPGVLSLRASRCWVRAC